MMEIRRGIKFQVGRLLITPGAQSNLSQEDISRALRRHANGDWGELDAQDKTANEESLLQGCRLLSAYRSSNGTRFWIITEADRSATTILLPGEY